MSVTYSEIRELLDYDPITGHFTWRERGEKYIPHPIARATFNKRIAGARAGSIKLNKQSGYRYRRIRVLGKTYMESRLAWVWMTGSEPPEEIDHINRDPMDNSWSNLRASTRVFNSHNVEVRKNNSSGVTGIGKSASGKWIAHCSFMAKQYHMGVFAEIDEAALSLLDFRAEHGIDPVPGMQIAVYHQHAAGVA